MKLPGQRWSLWPDQKFQGKKSSQREIARNKNKCNNKLFDMFLQIDMVSEVKDDVKNGSTAVTSVKEAYSGLNVSRNSVQVLSMNDNEYKLSGFVRQSLKNQQE